jgi:hypothetical protein
VGALGNAGRVWVRCERCARALAPRAAARPAPHDAARGSAPTCAPRQRARPRRRICLQQPSPERFQHPPLLLLLGLSAPFQRDTLSATPDPPPPAHFSTLVPASSAPSPPLHDVFHRLVVFPIRTRRCVAHGALVAHVSTCAGGNGSVCNCRWCAGAGGRDQAW